MKTVPRNVKVQFQQLPLDLLDEPVRPMRRTITDEHLRNLAQSLRDVGQIHPILVEREDGRYRIHVGHCRYLAAKLASWTHLWAAIWPAGTVTAEALTLHENLYRDDPNPADEAEFLGKLCEENCRGDVDQLSAMVRQTRSYVEERLLLLRGDPEILAAVRGGRIGLGVARTLNRVGDQGYRRMYLESAVRGGATVRLVEQWRIDYERLHAAQASAAAAAPGAAPAPSLPPPPGLVCFICDESDNPHDLVLLHVHRGCQRVVLDKFLRSFKGPAPEAT